jgi:2-keto-4-pentenoate hydratase/2-oxohepta-3-ene-1,7-dioic acid hydratase in catechol pathway
MTGTPEGVGPVAPGDVMTCMVENIGSMRVTVE